MRYPLNRKGDPSFAPQVAYLALTFGTASFVAWCWYAVTGGYEVPLWAFAASLLAAGYGIGFFAKGGD